MKLLLTVVLVLGVGSAYAAETKRVCHDVVVKGKTVQQCKNIKVHKKVEGTKVPEKAPTKPKSNKK